ncbi:MAG: AMP-dependent synthetase/ligase [Gemmataceae bacterium]
MMIYRNLAEAHRRQAERFGTRVAVRFPRNGHYQDLSWSEYRNAVRACAAALVDTGIQPGDRVGLLGENRVEWLFADLGILTAGAVTVSPHAALSARQIHFQLRDAGARWLFVSTAAQLEKALHVQRELPDLTGIVVFDSQAASDGAIAWDEFLKKGRDAQDRLMTELNNREAALELDALATIMYTSGTTGDSKGVMLSHGNIVSNVTACLEAEPVQPDELNLCWLPLSHIYARTCDFYEWIVAGATLCLAESPETVVANLAEIQPHCLSCVPRFYEKVLAAVASPDPAIMGERLRHIFGPRIRFLGAGGAPLPVALERILRDAGLPILTGYGLTESAPVLTFNLAGQCKVGTVGRALPGVELRISADGEVLARGPNIMLGYWNNAQATAETICDGWLHTGDLGSLDADGYLTITGRKKDLLVLSNGKKVVPTYIEGLLVADDCIDQAVVYGEGRHFLTALLVPHWDSLRAAISINGPPVADRTSNRDLARDPAVLETLQKRLMLRLADVANYEQVKKFVVVPEPFSVASGEMTVSLKLRRNIVFAKYAAELEALYRE